MNIAELADQYQAAKDNAERIEAELQDAKAFRDNLKGRLIDAMLEEETDSIGRNGRRYTVCAKTKYSKAAGADDQLFDLLREQGLGDIIRETVNANTLQAAMKQLAEDNGGELPEEYRECINEYNYTDISVRRTP